MKALGLAILLLLCGNGLPAGPGGQESSDRSTYVLVHGAWGGGWDWKGVEGLLREAGHEAYRPTLTGLGERVHLARPEVNLGTHVQDIVNVLEFEDLSSVILVGHSYGGMVITGVVHRIPDRVAKLVYVDALLPEDGESVFDLLPGRARLEEAAQSGGDGWRIPPWWPPGKDVPHPLATFDEPIRAANPEATSIEGIYVLTLEPGAEADDFSPSANRARKRGWPTHELRTGHNPQRTMPKELVEILLSSR